MRLSSIFFFSSFGQQKKSFVSKKICGTLLFETLKIKKSYFLNSNTRICSRLYGKCKVTRAFLKLNLMNFFIRIWYFCLKCLACNSENVAYFKFGFFWLLQAKFQAQTRKKKSSSLQLYFFFKFKINRIYNNLN